MFTPGRSSKQRTDMDAWAPRRSRSSRTAFRVPRLLLQRRTRTHAALVAHALHAIPLRTPYVHAPRSAHVFSDSSRTWTPRALPTSRHSEMRCISSWNCCITDYEHGLLIVHHTCISIAIHRRSLFAPASRIMYRSQVLARSAPERIYIPLRRMLQWANESSDSFHTLSLRAAIRQLPLPPPLDAGASYVVIRTEDGVSQRMREGPRWSRRQATRVFKVRRDRVDSSLARHVHEEHFPVHLDRLDRGWCGFSSRRARC
ncbi:hypothetical protein K466DRAFT_664210, partial [Polyporus arcularius HHB13444]